MSANSRILVRKPTAVFPPAQSAPAYRVDGLMKGLRVGIRTDPSWLSWLRIAKDWARRLLADGAVPVLFTISDHTGEQGEQARARLLQWAAGIDCAAVGLGT
ncbi:MAG TPA: hypothetical protein VLK85_05795 [Ramlibacter sp.]|nr:hypothetical protein [Ramlibacter sp.]